MWLWMAADAQTRTDPCRAADGRDGGAAMKFIDDLASPIGSGLLPMAIRPVWMRGSIPVDYPWPHVY
ncbi:MAG: hypothetical protein ACRECN_02365 [Methylocella sp.]